MTSNHIRSWRAQEPSASFTERTVAALLHERRPRRAFAGRRWAIAGAMAAVLAGGAAWGLEGWSLRARPPSPPSPPSAIAPSPPPAPRVVHAPPVDVAPSASPAPPAVRRKVETPPANSAGARRRVVVPHCFCSPNEAICDCF